jgi:hypothetical protein
MNPSGLGAIAFAWGRQDGLANRFFTGLARRKNSGPKCYRNPRIRRTSGRTSDIARERASSLACGPTPRRRDSHEAEEGRRPLARNDNAPTGAGACRIQGANPVGHALLRRAHSGSPTSTRGSIPETGLIPSPGG